MHSVPMYKGGRWPPKRRYHQTCTQSPTSMPFGTTICIRVLMAGHKVTIGKNSQNNGRQCVTQGEMRETLFISTENLLRNWTFGFSSACITDEIENGFVFDGCMINSIPISYTVAVYIGFLNIVTYIPLTPFFAKTSCMFPQLLFFAWWWRRSGVDGELWPQF